MVGQSKKQLLHMASASGSSNTSTNPAGKRTNIERDESFPTQDASMVPVPLTSRHVNALGKRHNGLGKVARDRRHKPVAKRTKLPPPPAGGRLSLASMDLVGRVKAPTTVWMESPSKPKPG